jgi:hypothetical protein
VSIYHRLSALGVTQFASIPIYASECTGGQILNFQNTFNRACDEIKMEIQTEHFFGNLISMRLVKELLIEVNCSKLRLYYLLEGKTVLD